MKGYQVVESFKDDISGKEANRPEMTRMLKWLRANKHHGEHVVIIDDISRLARGLQAHLDLRASLQKAGGRLESPSIEFGEDSDSILVENLLASVAQHQRDKNGEQTRNRMRARVQNGFWVWQPPIGYKHKNIKGQGKTLVRDEPFASIIQEGLEGFASGRFTSQIEVARFLESHPEYPKDKRGKVNVQRVKELLTRILYAGYFTLPNWGLSMVKGKHEGLIDLETFNAIQDRLNKKVLPPVRADSHEDFPLRGFVACGCCGNPLTSAWSKGRHKKYPYYLCHNKGCAMKGKSIRKETLEGEFEGLLKELKLSPDLFELAYAAFKACWDKAETHAKERLTRLKYELSQVERRIDQLLDRITDSDSMAVITAYEKKIAALEFTKAEITEKIAKMGKSKPDFNKVFRTAFAFLANPCNLWYSDAYEDKRAVLKLVFADKLTYVRNEGFRTAKTTLPFNMLEAFANPNSEMVPPAGIEPALRKGTGF